MKWGNRSIPVSIVPGFYIHCALLFLLLPVQWVFALAVSAAVHEVGHIAALRLTQTPIEGICIRPLGILLQTQPMESGKELFCASAGPVCGLCLVSLFRWVPEIALFALIHSLYNLLPMYPADGGRILHSLCRLVFPDKLAEKIEKIVSFTAVTLCVAVGIYGTLFAKLGLLPGVFGVAMVVNALKKQK